MRIPSAILVIAAVALALPAGWGLGVVLAYAVAGPDFGQLPALTVPVSVIAAIVFALSPSIAARTRLAMLGAAAGFFVLVGLLAPYF
ncbi:MAG TPA: hypothetical protein VH678_08755 [Xanthobacteraceae bacterium]|jgi:hypothetical protein